MRSKIFIITIASVLTLFAISSPAIKLLERAGLFKLPELGNIIEKEKEYENPVLDFIELAKADIADTYTNYLPGYAYIVTAYQTSQSNFNRPWNDMLSKLASAAAKPVSAEPVETDAVDSTDVLEASNDSAEVPADTPGEPHIVSSECHFVRSLGEGINIYAIDAVRSDGSKVGLLTSAFNTGVDTYTKRMHRTAEQVNAIAAANTDVNVYFYMCSRFQDCEAFEDVVPGEPSTKPLVDEFFSLLDPRIKTDRLKIDSLDDSVNKLFLTDHHWNAYGMYEAYCDIVNMIRADSPSVAEPRPLGVRYDVEGAEYYGTFARTSGYYEYTDSFFFYDYDLPEHELVANNPYNFETVMKRYLSGKFSKDLGADHYVNFYPYAQYLKYPSNSTGRVLLVLGDSYSRGISELLASAFDETYIFDYRRIHEIGNYNDFIAEHGITDVLFMQYSLRGVFDNQNDNTLNRIKLD